MQLHELVNTIGQDLQRRYGEKVHKLTLHGGFSCPNRDGTIGRGGCTFCNVASFADEEAQVKSIHDQLIDRAGEIDRAKNWELWPRVTRMKAPMLRHHNATAIPLRHWVPG